MHTGAGTVADSELRWVLRGCRGAPSRERPPPPLPRLSLRSSLCPHCSEPVCASLGTSVFFPHCFPDSEGLLAPSPHKPSGSRPLQGEGKSLPLQVLIPQLRVELGGQGTVTAHCRVVCA